MAVAKYLRGPGQPPKFQSAAELQKRVNEYFDWCDMQVRQVPTDRGYKEIKKPYTMSGLALFLGCDRRTLVNYSEKDEFFPIIKAAKQRVEGYIEEGMLSGELVSTPAIFNLKNNFGWQDKKEIEAVVSNGDVANLPPEIQLEVYKRAVAQLEQRLLVEGGSSDQIKISE